MLVQIHKNNLELLSRFLENAGSTLEHFRYFNSRSFDVLNQHLFTAIWLDDDQPVCYGHLDEEEGIVWLGIAVVENQKRQGLGKKMMRHLLNFARKNNIPKIRLSVDLDNEAAIQLYLDCGFILLKKTKTIQFMEWNVKEQNIYYVSTMALRKKALEESITLAKEWAFPLEFSSGLPHRKELITLYENSDIERMPHNYFPAPAIPFVLNLASDNEKIRTQSIQHCLQGLKLSKQANSPFFAAHAGFCIDPNPEELGKKLNHGQVYSRAKHWAIFLESVNIIVEKAEELAIDFLIENNVVAQMNLGADGSNPLFCGTPNEMIELVQSIDHPRLHILLDTAHLKVSSNTLNFNLKEGTEKLLSIVKGVHHSDNDGLLDSNEKLTKEYWFLPFMKQYKQRTHVIEVKDLNVKEILHHFRLLERATKN